MIKEQDLQILLASRLMPSAGNIFIGVGTPLFVGLMAKRQYPEISGHVEAAAIGINPRTEFGTIGDAHLIESAENLVPISDFFNFWMKKITYDLAILRALEVDSQGKINTFKTETSTFGGVGGGVVGALNAKSIVILTSIGNRGLVESLLCCTNPLGMLPGAEDKNISVVTENAVFKRRAGEKMFLCTMLSKEGLDVEAVFQGWRSHALDDVPIAEFTLEELNILEQIKSLFKQH
jgi:acyl CoA:acetate/3-ketoacid CoA transferase beta subunit